MKRITFCTDYADTQPHFLKDGLTSTPWKHKKYVMGQREAEMFPIIVVFAKLKSNSENI